MDFEVRYTPAATVQLRMRLLCAKIAPEEHDAWDAIKLWSLGEYSTTYFVYKLYKFVFTYKKYGDWWCTYGTGWRIAHTNRRPFTSFHFHAECHCVWALLCVWLMVSWLVCTFRSRLVYKWMRQPHTIQHPIGLFKAALHWPIVYGHRFRFWYYLFIFVVFALHFVMYHFWMSIYLTCGKSDFGFQSIWVINKSLAAILFEANICNVFVSFLNVEYIYIYISKRKKKRKIEKRVRALESFTAAQSKTTHKIVYKLEMWKLNTFFFLCHRYKYQLCSHGQLMNLHHQNELTLILVLKHEYSTEKNKTTCIRSIWTFTEGNNNDEIITTSNPQSTKMKHLTNERKSATHKK